MSRCYPIVLACLLVVIMHISAVPIPGRPYVKTAEKETILAPVAETKVTPEEEELTELTKTEDKTLSRVPKVKSTQAEEMETQHAESKTSQSDATEEEEKAASAKLLSDGASQVAAKIPDKEMGRFPNLDLSPGAVAEYLIITGDFKGFETAVADLVKSGVMTSEEAVLYKDRVGLELESLLQEAQNELLQDKVEEELEAPQQVAPWASYNMPLYDTPMQEFPGYDAPRPRRNMADDSRDQLILAELIDRVVSEYAQAQEKAAYNERLRENDAQAQAMMDMILSNRQNANQEPVYGRIVENPVDASEVNPVEVAAANPVISAEPALNPTGQVAQSTSVKSITLPKVKVDTPTKPAKPQEKPVVPVHPIPNKDVSSFEPAASNGKKTEETTN